MGARATIYVRISRDREGAGLGVKAQEADCRDLVDRLGWTVVSVHVDNDLSAYSGKRRPGYRALLDEIRDGTVDAVVAWHTDRLHRSPVELEDYVALCEAQGVATHTVKAGHIDLATPSGRLVARQLGSVARYEVEHAIERMQRAKLRSATAGTWKGGRRPYGYAADGVTLLDAEAARIREGTAEILAGASLSGIARRWNTAGAVTSTGRPWDASAVRRVLTRPRNAGLMEHQGQLIGRAEWPAIVPEQEWRAALGIITDPARRTSPGSVRRWLGSGLYLCGVCAGPMISTTSGRQQRQGYRCKRSGHVNRVADEVDEYVRQVIAARLRRDDLADLLASNATDPAAFDAQTSEAVVLRARLDELAALFAAGAIDGPQLAGGTRNLRDRLEALERAQARAVHGSALDVVAGATDPGRAFLDAPLDRQRAIVHALATVTIYPSGRGRPAGWKPGESYFRPETVTIEPRVVTP